MRKGAGPREPEAAAAECRAALCELCRFAAGYRQLALGVGSSADGRRLRLALEEGGRRGFELSQGLHNQLLAELTRSGGEVETHAMLERTWVLCLSALESFLQDLGRVHRLSLLFPVPAPSGAPLVRTGISSQGPKGRNLRQASRKVAQGAGELGQWVQQLEELLVKMEQEVNVPAWSVEPTLGDLGPELSLEGSDRGGAFARCLPTLWTCCRAT